MNTDKLAYYSFILAPIIWILRGIIVVYYSCVITYDYISQRFQSLLSMNKETDFEGLEKMLCFNDELLNMLKQTYIFCVMYNSLSFRDKLKIKMGSMTMPQVSVSEEIVNMSAHEFMMEWKELHE